jgi:hypothetical protein
MNGVVDTLTAMGVPGNVLNASFGGGADPTGVSNSDTAFADAVANFVSTGQPVIIPPGTYKITGTLNWKVAGLVVITAGAANVTITMATANTPILQVAGQGQSIGGLTLQYTAQQTSGQTSAIGIEFGDSTVGSCFMSHLYVQLAYIGLTMNPALSSGSAAGMFSCLFENIHVLGWYQNAMNLAGNAGGGHSNCTGCVFNNTYLHNNYTGSEAASNSYPLFLESWDELVFNQLNIEHTECYINDIIGLSGVSSCVINSMHMEEVQLSGSGGIQGYVYLNGSAGQSLVVNGWTLRYNTMTGATDNPVIRFGGTGSMSAIINGFTEGTDNTISHAHPWVDFGSVAGGYFSARGINSSQTTVPAINSAAGCFYQIGPPNTWTPQDNNLLTASGDPFAVSGSTAPAAGTLYLVKLKITAAITISNLWFLVATAGSGTSTGSYAGLYSSSGTLLSGSADIGTSLTSSAAFSVALTTAQPLLAGSFVWAAVLVNMPGMPALRNGIGSTGGPASLNLTAAAARWASNGTGFTALPGTITPASNNTGGPTYWCGVS